MKKWVFEIKLKLHNSPCGD
jgi:hypothetical protein